MIGEREEALGKVWHLPVAPVTTTRDMCQLVGALLGQPMQTMTIESVAQAQEIGVFDEVMGREYSEVFYQYLEPQIVDSQAIEQHLGVHATPLDIALQQTVTWYQEQGTQPA